MPMPRSTDDYIYKSYPKPGNNTTFTRLEGKNGIDYFEIYEDGDNRQKMDNTAGFCQTNCRVSLSIGLLPFQG